ncbi:MAG: hypothetical protein PHD43_01490 [Methylococcales bacterium]|nr:hypothetical protein [Methylococcales bacterium]
MVSRERTWQFNPEQAFDIDTATGGTVRGSKSPFRRQAGSQFVQIIRRRLKASGINPSWNAIDRIMASQCRVMASFRRADGRALHARKATRADPGQLAIYRALSF